MNTITPLDLEEHIQRYMAVNSGFEHTRPYLSISHVAGCPHRAAREFRDGFEENPEVLRMCYAGYDQERSVRSILLALGVLQSFEVTHVVAPFDKRLQGHPDGITTDGQVIEIKSVSRKKFERIQNDGRALFEHFAQVQLYLRYANLLSALIIYRCRETYEHSVFEISYNPTQADKLEEKAKRILQALDASTLPACECGKCKG